MPIRMNDRAVSKLTFNGQLVITTPALYLHSIAITRGATTNNWNVEWSIQRCLIINSSSTPFTWTTMCRWFWDNGYTSNTKTYPILGTFHQNAGGVYPRTAWYKIYAAFAHSNVVNKLTYMSVLSDKAVSKTIFTELSTAPLNANFKDNVTQVEYDNI